MVDDPVSELSPSVFHPTCMLMCFLTQF